MLTLSTLSEKEHIIWRESVVNSQHAQTLGHDDLWLRAITTIDGFRTASSIQFHSQGLGQPVVWFYLY